MGNLRRLLAWIETRSDPVVEDGEEVILRGAGWFGPAGHVDDGVVGLTSRRISFLPGGKRALLAPSPIRVDVRLDEIEIVGIKGSGTGALPLAEASLRRTDGREYKLRTPQLGFWMEKMSTAGVRRIPA